MSRLSGNSAQQFPLTGNRPTSNELPFVSLRLPSDGADAKLHLPIRVDPEFQADRKRFRDLIDKQPGLSWYERFRLKDEFLVARGLGHFSTSFFKTVVETMVLNMRSEEFGKLADYVQNRFLWTALKILNPPNTSILELPKSTLTRPLDALLDGEARHTSLALLGILMRSEIFNRCRSSNDQVKLLDRFVSLDLEGQQRMVIEYCGG